MKQLPAVQLPDLATLILAADSRVIGFANALVSDMIEAGRLLTEAKALLPHGQFGPWCESELGFNKMRVSRYMRAFKAKSNASYLLTGDETLKELVELGSKPSKWAEANRLHALVIASHREAYDACTKAMRLISEDTECTSAEIQRHRVEFEKRMEVLREDAIALGLAGKKKPQTARAEA